MRKLIAMGAGAVGAAALLMALVGQGNAAALPDVSGQPYGKVKQVLAQSGMKGVVATRVGDRANEDDCIVDRVQDGSKFSSASTGRPGAATVYIYLNCYGKPASTDSPGYSQQNPMAKTVEQNRSNAQ